MKKYGTIVRNDETNLLYIMYVFMSFFNISNKGFSNVTDILESPVIMAYATLLN